DSGERLFFPNRLAFCNIRVQGRQQGLRLLEVSDPEFYMLHNEGGYDGVDIIANSKFLFEDVQLADLSSADDQEKQHISFPVSGAGSYTDTFALYPELYFSGCKGLVGHFGESCMKLVFTNCSLNRVFTSASAALQGSIEFWGCTFQSVFTKEDAIPYVLS